MLKDSDAQLPMFPKPSSNRPPLVRRASFVRDANGVAATEFVLIAPMLILLFFAIMELDRYMMIERRGEQAAVFAAEFLSRDDDNILTNEEHAMWQDIWMIVNPSAVQTVATEVASQGKGGKKKNEPVIEYQNLYYSRWASSVEFSDDPSCSTQPCALLPSPVWSGGFQEQNTGAVARSCTLEIVENSAPPSSGTLREGEVGRAPVVIVDLLHQYVPIIPNPLLQSIDMRFMAVRSTRSGQTLRTDPNDAQLLEAQCNA